MMRAIALAVQSATSGRGGPFAALVVKDGTIVAEGTNCVTSANDPTAHAEIVAIREACRALGTFQLDGCDLYSSSEPCPMCFGAIYWARPRRVFFGATHEDAAAVGFDDSMIYDQIEIRHSLRKIPFIPLMRDEAIAPFEAWAANPDRVRY